MRKMKEETRKMRSRKEICEELDEFIKEHGIERRTYETMLLEAIFKLALDIREIELKPMFAKIRE